MPIIVDNDQGGDTPAPTALLSARELCEMSLGKIGAFVTNDEAADPVEMDRSLKWLDIIVGEIAGTNRCHWLIPTTVRFEWPDELASDALGDLMGSEYPPEGVLFPIKAWLVNATTGKRVTELKLVRRHEYEDHVDLALPGQPEQLYIDRQSPDLQASLYPVPSLGAGWQVDLMLQKYAKSMLGQLTGSTQAGELAHGFSQEWQLYLITRLAAELGDGPVRRLPMSEIAEFRTIAGGLLGRLETYSNREKRSEPARTKRYGG